MSAAPPPVLRVEGLRRMRQEEQAAIDGVDLQISPGEAFCLLGQSGSGARTMLHALGGLVQVDEGRIELDGEDITAAPAHRRQLNTVFRSNALFPHLSVAGNIRFGLQREGLGKAQMRERLDEMLALLQLEAQATLKPQALTSEQQRRVALARCLAKRPRLLLLEEPLGGLDQQQRVDMQLVLLRMRATLDLTFVIATRDWEEAITMATRVGVMRSGRLEQVGSPREIYDTPRNRFVAGQVGITNAFDGEVTGQRDSGFLTVRVEGMGDDLQVSGAAPLAPGTKVTVMVRPERLRFLTLKDRVDESFVSNAFEAEVTQRIFRGERFSYVVSFGGRTLQVSIPHGFLDEGAPSPEVGERVRLAFTPPAAWVLSE
ncbi:MAG: ABC transporter ATP-binding protein [Pseudomonadota bacterium]